MRCFDREVLPKFACDTGGGALLDEQRGCSEPGMLKGPFLGAITGAVLGVLVGAGMTYRAFSSPVAIGLAVTPAILTLLTTIIAFSALGYAVSKTYDYANNIRGERPLLASCAKMGAVGAGLGLLAGVGLVSVACFSSSFAIASLAAIGLTATPLNFILAAGSAIALSTIALCAVGAVVGSAVVSVPHERRPHRVVGILPINVIPPSNNPSVDLPFGNESSCSDVLSVFSVSST